MKILKFLLWLFLGKRKKGEIVAFVNSGIKLPDKLDLVAEADCIQKLCEGDEEAKKKLSESGTMRVNFRVVTQVEGQGRLGEDPSAKAMKREFQHLLKQRLATGSAAEGKAGTSLAGNP